MANSSRRNSSRSFGSSSDLMLLLIILLGSACLFSVFLLAFNFLGGAGTSNAPAAPGAADSGNSASSVFGQPVQQQASPVVLVTLTPTATPSLAPSKAPTVTPRYTQYTPAKTSTAIPSLTPYIAPVFT